MHVAVATIAGFEVMKSLRNWQVFMQKGDIWTSEGNPASEINRNAIYQDNLSFLVSRLALNIAAHVSQTKKVWYKFGKISVLMPNVQAKKL